MVKRNLRYHYLISGNLNATVAIITGRSIVTILIAVFILLIDFIFPIVIAVIVSVFVSIIESIVITFFIGTCT